MNRRDLFKGLAVLAGGTASGLILPPTVAEAAEDGRRFWALGSMPNRDNPFAHNPFANNPIEDNPPYPMRPYLTPFIDYDELIHTTRELHENFFPVGHPLHEMWQTMVLMPRALEARERR